MIIKPSRRGFLGGLLGLVATPAIVHATNIMPISVFKELPWASSDGMPPGWFQCDGGVLRCQDYPELFSVIGRVHGGDGINTFAVPDLRRHEIPGRIVPYMEGELVSAISGQRGGGHPPGMIMALRKPRVPLPQDTQVLYSPFSGYHEFPPKGWDNRG